jgi:BioD-like phosphotransacetylase family protein
LGVIYVVSVAAAAGKTAICAGLARNLMNQGKNVGYLKPSEAGSSDGDIAFMKHTLGLENAVNAPDLIAGRDVVLVEAGLGPKADHLGTRATYGAARDMKAKVIAVEAYSGKKSKYADVYQGFGDTLLGVVVNKVPVSQLERAAADAAKQFGKAGIKALGVIPEDRSLLAITVGELAAAVGGKFLNNAEKADELVENYMLGAMVVDSGLDYFARKPGKAAIVRQDRPDMQLAALETSTRCLVLSGSSEPPFYNVLQKAEGRGIPVIATDLPADDIIAGIEAALDKARCHQEPKLKRLAGLIEQNLTIPA